MIKYSFILIILLLNINTFASDTFDYSKIAQIPILAEGRVKPFDTFSRNVLLKIHNKTSLKDKSATQWLIELLFDQKKAYHEAVFKVTNDDVIKALDLKKNADHLYTFIEIYTSLNKNDTLLAELGKKELSELEISQRQILELYRNILLYLDISRSFSIISPEIEVPEKSLRNFLSLNESGKITYLDLHQKEAILKSKAIRHFNLLKDSSTPEARRIIYLIRYLGLLSEDSFSKELKILPQLPLSTSVNDWIAPWQLDLTKKIPTSSLQTLKLWEKLYRSYQNHSVSDFNAISTELVQNANEFIYGQTTPLRLKIETFLNNYELLYKSAALYILSFFLLSLNFISKKRFLSIASLVTLSFGSFLHIVNIILRCYIVGRPPVTNLYESIVFVGFISVLFSLIFERKHKDGLGVFIGSVIGTILLFVSFGYQKDGDTMGMLVAVLDTNFWLATHVVTISIGYGCSLVAALLAHLYLFKMLKQAKNEELSILEKNIHGVVLYSLFFTTLGTILGGIWADQSWGRFWGWDPKENGALFLCLWLIWIVHGRIKGAFRKNVYASIVALTSIVVILAWFGVNLLNVGLHSYGFTENIAHNIMTFSSAEIVFLILINLRLTSIHKKRII